MANFIVTSTGDSDDDATVSGGLAAEMADGGGLSLREALILANADPTNAAHITFAAALAGRTLTLASGELTIASDVTIDGDALNGDDKADIIIDAAGGSRVFNVTGGVSILDSLVITGGELVGNGAGVNVLAGAELTIRHSTLADNHSNTLLGGGLYNAGTVTLSDSTISQNSALQGGGIFNTGILTATNTTLFGNHAANFGGGIYNQSAGTATLINATLTGNSATRGGGVLDTGDLTLTNSVVAGNRAPTSADIDGTVPFTGANVVSQTGITGIGFVIETSLAKIFADLATIDPTSAPNDSFIAGVLADNGGPVATVALAARVDNPALDRGDGTLAPAADARGEDRVDVPNTGNGSATADLGAFELLGPFETPSLNVTILTDVVDLRDNLTSLREAILFANSNADASTITFDASLKGQTLFLRQGELLISTDVTIEGDIDSDGKADITISADSALGADDATSRALRISDGGPGSMIAATLDGLVVRDGKSNSAGGIYVGESDRLTLTNSIVTGNTTIGAGGGIGGGNKSVITVINATIADNIAVDAGGIFVGADATLTLISSTVSGNRATSNAGDAGGIFGARNAAITLVNSTIVNNAAGKQGGGVYGFLNNAITAINSTITGNSAGAADASGDGGGIYNYGSGAVTKLVNSIVTGNIAAHSGNDLHGGAISTASNHADLVFEGGNIIGSAPLNFATVAGQDAHATSSDGASQAALEQVFASVGMVDPDGAGGRPAFLAGLLADNGGPVQTVAIRLGGSAQDAGVTAAAVYDHDGNPATAQVPIAAEARGAERVSGASVDLGAVEIQATPQTLVVTTLADEAYDGGDYFAETADGHLSLREALALANSNADVNTITFADGLAGTLFLTNGELTIATSLSIDGGGVIGISADFQEGADNAAGRVLTVDGVGATGISAALSGLVIRDGKTAGKGGGILVGANDTLTITNSTVSGNDAGDGGGIYVTDGAAVALLRTTVADNSATGSGGGLYNYSGSLTARDTTFSGNSAGDYGGAIRTRGGTADRSTITLTNVTIADNEAGLSGGAINNNGFATLTNVTITDNHAGTLGGGIRNFNSLTTVSNSIIAGNDADTDGDDFSQAAGGSTFTGVNIFGQAGLGRAGIDISGAAAADIFAGGLTDNGGPVQTVAIRQGGLAHNAGDDAAAAYDHDGDPATAPVPIPTDARGFDRTVGSVDIGAFEQQDNGTFVVTTLADEAFDGGTFAAEMADGGGLSLREALALANDDATADDIITFLAGLSGTLFLTNGELKVTSSLSIDGGGVIGISADTHEGADDATGRVFTIDGAGATGISAALSGLVIRDGKTTGKGGGILVGANDTLTITNSTVSGNDAGDGGGIYVTDGAAVALLRTTVADNGATGSGGGLYNYSGSLTARDTTFSGNSAGDYGGAIRTRGGTADRSTITLTNVTIADNEAGLSGGAINNNGFATLTNVTITDNHAGTLGGGIRNFNSLTTVSNSIIAGNDANTDGDDFSQATGTSTFTGVNIFGQAGLGRAGIDISGAAVADIFAGPLADNGGPVQTVALKLGGLAHDAGDDAAAVYDHDGNPATAPVPIPTDARGFDRTVGSVDIGAFEFPDAAPTLGINTGLALAEGATGAIAASALDYDDTVQPDSSITFTITTAAAFGTLFLGSAALGAGDAFTQDDINNNRLSYVHDGSESTNDSFGFLVSDGAGNVTGAQSFTFGITPVNDVPVNSVPGTLDIAPNADTAIAGLSVADPDAGDGTLTTTLNVLHGTLTANGTGASGSGTATVTISGTLSEINTALGTVAYRGAPGYFGDDTLTMTTNDGGNSGDGGAHVDVDVVMLKFPDTAPTVGINTGLTLAEGATGAIAASALDYDDTVQPDTSIIFTITAAAAFGALVLGTTALGLGDTFTQDDINNDRLTYVHGGAESANDSFGFSVSDGAGGTTTGQSFTLIVTPVNDVPANAVPGTLDIEANTDTAIAGLSISDPDADGGTMTTSLSVTHGTLTVGGAGVAGSGTASVTITGTLAEINTALGTVSYRGAQDYFGDDTLTVSTNDGGNSGAGGARSDTDQVTIHLNTHLTGTPGPDGFDVLPGNSRVDAFGAVDTMTFDFALVDAIVTYQGNKVVIDGPSSHTVLTGVERFEFTDGVVDNNDGNWLIDDLFYYSQNHDVWNAHLADAHVDADSHYDTHGRHEGRDPSAFFSTAFYLAVNPDVRIAGINPVLHYAFSGWQEGRPSSLTFDPAQYLAANPDVAAAHVDPLFHFLVNGAGEGRQPFAPTELIAANGFDFVYYLHGNPDVASAGVDPFSHFQNTGWKEGRNPNAWFDTAGYLANYTDVANAHINPLDHYNQHGWQEGRDPSLGFDTAAYLAANPDVAAARVNPLLHFLEFGMHEGRSAIADGLWG